MKLLLLAENPQQLVELAGFVEELEAREAYVVVHGERSSVEKYSYKIFSKIFLVSGTGYFPDLVLGKLSELYNEYNPQIVAGVATKNNTTALSLLAAEKKIPFYSEILDVEITDSDVLLKRQVMGGRAYSVYRVKLPSILTFPKKKYSYEGETGAEIVEEKGTSRIELVEVEPKVAGEVDLESAEVVVGVGRGFRKKEDLKLAEELAKLVNGVLGATRPIVADYGWLGEDRWIGISGKKIRPKLYIAIGLSGAPQHMAATMDSKIIVAINKDKNAPVFQYADYGVVADLYKFLPVLVERLKEKLK